jgi:hypothetical protein
MVWLNAINRTLRVSLPAVYLRRADEAYSGDLWLSLRQTACLLALNRAGATEYVGMLPRLERNETPSLTHLMSPSVNDHISSRA